MNESGTLLDKLTEVEKRYQEIEDALGHPEVVSKLKVIVERA